MTFVLKHQTKSSSPIDPDLWSPGMQVTRSPIRPVLCALTSVEEAAHVWPKDKVFKNKLAWVGSTLCLRLSQPRVLRYFHCPFLFCSIPLMELIHLLSPAGLGAQKGDYVVAPSVRPSVRASTFIAVSAITHKLFAISIWNLSHTCTTWKGRTLLIVGVAGSKMADWGGHLEKKVFCNKWKTAYGTFSQKRVR